MVNYFEDNSDEESGAIQDTALFQKEELINPTEKETAQQNEKQTYNFDPDKSIKRNLLDLSDTKKNLKAENERIRKQQKAIAIGDFVGLVGKSIGAWGGVTPRVSNPTYFAKLEEQRENNNQMYDALDLQERNYKISDYYKQEANQLAKEESSKQRKSQEVIQRLKNIENQEQRIYDEKQSEAKRQHELTLLNDKNNFTASENEKNRKLDYYKTDKNSKPENYTSLIIEDAVSGKSVAVPKSYWQTAKNKLLKDSAFINKLSVIKEDLGTGYFNDYIDSEICQMYQQHLIDMNAKTQSPNTTPYRNYQLPQNSQAQQQLTQPTSFYSPTTKASKTETDSLMQNWKNLID